MKNDTSDARTFYNRGVAYNRKRQYDLAIQNYDQAIKLNPHDDHFFNNRGNAYANKGQYERAFEDFNEAIRLNANDGQIFFNRGNAFIDTAAYERAIQDFDEAIRLEPNFSKAFYNRGNAYSNKGLYSRAIIDFDQAIRLSPDDAAAFNNRGIAKQQTGDIAGGNADIAKALRLGKRSKRILGRVATSAVVFLVAGGSILEIIFGTLAENWSNILSVLVVYSLIVLAFCGCVAVISRKAKAPLASVHRFRMSGSLLVWAFPACGIFWEGSYTSPHMPWSDMLGGALANLGYMMGFLALVTWRVDFEIFGLHHGRTKLVAAVAFFVAGTLLINIPPFAS